MGIGNDIENKEHRSDSALLEYSQLKAKQRNEQQTNFKNSSLRTYCALFNKQAVNKSTYTLQHQDQLNNGYRNPLSSKAYSSMVVE